MRPNSGFIRFAMTEEANVYVAHNKEIGLQFLSNFLSLFPFGKQVMILCFKVVDNVPFL